MTKTCPLCKKTLSLKQINMTLAVYICEDLTCQYPVGYECVVVNRNFANMKKDVDSSNDKILDSWIEDATDNSQTETEWEKGAKAETSQSSAWIEDTIDSLKHTLQPPGSEPAKDGVAATDFDDILEFLDNFN